ncbi:putative AC9 transposase [Dissostichus eleginoides]|uniref:AC9 transposase n=1 Tax=Dissostichus eleginoides TaxID=100907 RepID=A0AAD9B8F1_DISEL|nr:putative AC9 transposase [Dissostichus eleginoides]
MLKTSAVWDHFKLDDDKKKAVCQICDKKLAYHGGTTTLKSHLNAVVRLAEHLHQRQTVREVEGEPAASDREEETAAPPPKKKKQQDMLMQSESDDEEEQEHDGDSAKKEMEQYLRDTTKIQSGPLAWWKHNSDRYPKLAFAAKHCLCVPATSTPSERIFSKAGYIRV